MDVSRHLARPPTIGPLTLLILCGRVGDVGRCATEVVILDLSFYFIDLCGLHQLINEPTRITEKTSTTIDLIFTNEPDKIVCSGVSHVGISDHSLIYAFRKLSAGKHTKGHTTISYRNFKHFDADSFRNDISLQDWDYIKTFGDPNQMWHAWKTIFHNVVDRHAPLRTKRVRGSKAPWITTQAAFFAFDKFTFNTNSCQQI